MVAGKATDNEWDFRPGDESPDAVACGGGRISVPLAKMGHKVTGFDSDEFMLMRALTKGKGINNLLFYKADAVNNDWGNEFDIVILAGNILSDLDYKQSQKLFIQKAANCVKQGGYMFLDFDCYLRNDKKMLEKKMNGFALKELMILVHLVDILS